MEQEYLVREIIVAVFLRRYKIGEKEISLKMEDIMNYAPKLEKLFNEEKLGTELFIKTPVSETYDTFKSFIISYMLGMELGHLNSECDKVILSINDHFINKYLKNISKYDEIINNVYSLLQNQENIVTPEQKIKKLSSI